MPRLILALFSFVMCFVFTGFADAATYAVAPFKVNGGSGYNYLQKAVPPMFSSRLFTGGQYEPISTQENLLNQKPAETKEEAESLRKRYSADYLIYGSITILGNNASIDVSVVGAKTYWQKATQNNINNLFNAIQTLADSINAEVFGQAPNRPAPTGNRLPMNDGIIVNETNPQASSYLNPELRYQGTETNRGRTKPLEYASYGFEIADYDNDGQNEVAFLNATDINVYEYKGAELVQIASQKIASGTEPIRIRSFNYNGNDLIVFTGLDKSSKNPNSVIYKLSGNKLTQLATSNYYLGVQRINPYEKPALIGQGGDKTRFVRGAVYKMNFNGSKVTRGGSLNLPSKANVFNFSWLPGAEKLGGNHLLVIDDSDKMLVFNSEGKRLYKTDDIYSSTGVGVTITRDMTGFTSKAGTEDSLFYYVPMRIAIADLDRNGQYEAITGKPVSTAAIILNNYRTYSQGEVHSMIWDGVGMNLLWKTRRIKGTIVDVDIADPNNDGVIDLVVNLNTYPGTFGTGKIRTLLVLYPLNTDNVDGSAVNYSE